MISLNDAYLSSEEQRKECLAEIKMHIESSENIPDQLKPELIKMGDEFLDRIFEQGGVGVHFYGMQLGWSHWVIRNDHLNLAPEFPQL